MTAAIAGPAIAPLEALVRVAHAPVIAFLHGDAGASLAWDDDPVPDPGSTLYAAAAVAARPGRDRDAPPDDGMGRTWAAVPPESFFFQCDYEMPATPPLLIAAPHVATWDAAGHCTIAGPDPDLIVQRFMAETLARPADEPPPARLAGPVAMAWDRHGHATRIARVRDLIAAGDCYQVNLAVPFRARFAPGPHRDLAAFLALVRASPAPYAAFIRHPGRPSVVSHSPECLLAARGDRLVSVPIKGTRRRGDDADAAWTALTASAKDGAELAMIVDLVRNDLGRVAEAGSVMVEDRAVRIDLPYVVHRAARIAARLAPHHSLADALLASFPAGSITGAPKRRVMDIIRELECCRRGAWCGSFGWLGPGGMDAAVAIRTAEVDGEVVRWHAGGGVVWDSEPEAEWDEVRAKASAMAAAWGGAV